MSTETVSEHAISLDADVPCDGISRQYRMGEYGWVNVDEPCDQPATYRWRVQCCGIRSGFCCEEHYQDEQEMDEPSVCAKCHTGPINVVWSRL